MQFNIAEIETIKLNATASENAAIEAAQENAVVELEAYNAARRAICEKVETYLNYLVGFCRNPYGKFSVDCDGYETERFYIAREKDGGHEYMSRVEVEYRNRYHGNYEFGIQLPGFGTLRESNETELGASVIFGFIAANYDAVKAFFDGLDYAGLDVLRVAYYRAANEVDAAVAKANDRIKAERHAEYLKFMSPGAKLVKREHKRYGEGYIESEAVIEGMTRKNVLVRADGDRSATRMPLEQFYDMVDAGRLWFARFGMVPFGNGNWEERAM